MWDVFAPDEGTHFVSRLWSRFGLRTLSIMVLLLGLVGGAVLSSDRQHQQRVSDDVQASIDRAQAVQLQNAASPQLAAAAQADEAAQEKAAAAAAKAYALAKQAEDARRARIAKTTSRSTTRTSPPSYGPIPTSCGDYTGNRAIGCSELLKAGFGLDQMPCLDKMWTHESNWRTTAENPSSGSYGIPQALPANKMAVYGSDYRTNPVPQIQWGLHYIEGRYNTPCGAWTFWQAHNWY